VKGFSPLFFLNPEKLWAFAMYPVRSNKINKAFFFIVKAGGLDLRITWIRTKIADIDPMQKIEEV